MNSEYQMNFENFRKIRDLTAGPHGIVSLYEDPSNQSQVAIKTLYQTDTVNNDNYQQFQREVQALINLKHSCIIPIIGYSSPTPRTETELSKPPKIATKFAQNGSLKDLLEKIQNGQTPDFVNDTWRATAIGSIVLGMEYIHSNNYIHRDLKPGNILVDDQGNVMIGDLGSSRLVDLEITYTKMVGSPFYMAPEMYDEGSYDEKVDAYSFALILYELLVGQPAFPKNIQPLPLMRKVCNGTRPEIPGDLHPEMQDIISKCWDVSPKNRYTFTEIYDKLKNVDFKITPNVDSERVKHLLREKSKIRVNVHLLNGEIYPMEIYPDDNHIEFRRKIGEYANLPINLVIPSIEGHSISCCWGCNLGQNPYPLKFLLRDWTYRTKLHNDFDIDLLYQIRAKYYIEESNFDFTTISTKFFMKPGTISDLFNEITSEYRNLWFLKNCNFKVYLGDEELVPSNETMIEKGITTNSELSIIRNYNKTVTIENNEFECNLDDPVEELLWRYMKSRHVHSRPNKFVFLKKNGNPIDRLLTLNEAGIVNHDHLQIGYINSNREIEVDIDFKKCRLFVPPNATFIDFMWNALLATGSSHPIGTIELSPRLFINYDYTFDSAPELSANKYRFKKAYRYCIREYFLISYFFIFPKNIMIFTHYFK